MIVQGYASLFNVKDHGRDVVMPGAFKGMRAAKDLRFLWQHDQRNPIGVVRKVRAEKKGLAFEAEILTDTMYGKSAAALVAKGGLAVSIGYKTLKADHEERACGDNRTEMVRLLKDVDLREISLVSMPMCDGTEVWRAPATGDVSEKSLEEIERRLTAALETRAIHALKARVQALTAHQ